MTNDEIRMTKEWPMTKPEWLDNESDNDDSLDLAFWSHVPVDSVAYVLNDSPPSSSPKFDLEERTTLFGERIVRICKRIPVGPTNSCLISQLVRVGTSIGANYCEADDSVSKKEFKNKIGTCRKEAREIHLIFCKIYRNS